jgi:U3 small nucleolar ribonucleoprotein protein IMP3
LINPPSSRYNKLVGEIRQLANKISLLDSRDPFRAQQEKALLEKLYNMGITNTTAKFSDCRKVTVSAFCRRRLPIVMCRLKMAETVKEAVTFVEQGHIRVGPQTINDPAFLVNRTMEDYVTWVDTSKIKRKIMKYNDKVRMNNIKRDVPLLTRCFYSWMISIYCKLLDFIIFYFYFIFHITSH